MCIDLLVIDESPWYGGTALILACVVSLPIALVLVASTRWQGRGPTWEELLRSLLILVPQRMFGGRRYRFGWPVRRSVDRLYGLLVTESSEVVLVRHHRHDEHLYHTLPGGTIQRGPSRPRTFSRCRWARRQLGVGGWALIHLERKGRRQELVYAGRLPSRCIDAHAGARHRLHAVPLTAAPLAQIEVHPHGVARLVRGLAAERREPEEQTR